MISPRFVRRIPGVSASGKTIEKGILLRKLRGLTAAAGVAALLLLAGTASASAAPAQPFTAGDPVRPFIVGGEPASQRYDGMVSLQRLVRDDPNFHFCAGELITPWLVATQAHCVSRPDGTVLAPDLLHIRVGSNDRTLGGFVRQVSEVTVHPGWNWGRDPGRPVSDIARLRLLHPVIAWPMQIAPKVDDGTTRLIGWGLTENGATAAPHDLRQLDTRVVPAERCAAAGISAGELCVGNVGTAGACYGDSGGPALQRGRSGQWKAIGGASRETNPVCGQGPAVYTDLTAYAPWLLWGSLAPVTPAPGLPTVTGTVESADLRWIGGQPNS